MRPNQTPSSIFGSSSFLSLPPFSLLPLPETTTTTITTTHGSLSASIVIMSLMAVSLLFFLFLVFLFLLFLCRRWRLSSSHCSRSSETDEITRPLFSEDLEGSPGQSNESRIQIDENGALLRDPGSVTRMRTYPVESHNQVLEGNSVLDSSNDSYDDSQLGSTLKRPAVASWPVPDSRRLKNERESTEFYSTDRLIPFHVKDSKFPRRSSLTLEVIAGPSSGICSSRQSTDASILPLTIGRVPPSGLVLKDSEVSGKHAVVNWNANSMEWELIDTGSLNGTFLNSNPVHHPDVGSRQRGNPVPLSDGDIITLGTSTKISVRISEQIQQKMPGGVGIASEPMAARRGGKLLPMEDICLCQYPLPGFEQFGMLGVFDGHGGVEAAKTASKVLPENIVKLLSQPGMKEKVIVYSDASDVLRLAFALTEAAMDDHQCEGCTATVLLIWSHGRNDYFAQCANLGDSACILSVDGKNIVMTEDHRVTSMVERTRIAKTGSPLRDGESRLCGLNLGRMLGDKFLKEQDTRFSSEPYVSQVVQITKASTAFALIASDGLWDVISTKQAAQLVIESKEKSNGGDASSAEGIANRVLSEARTLRTKDNTSIIFVDFDTLRTDSCISF